MDMEKRLEAIEKRLAVLEDGHGLSGDEAETLELDITLPEADIDGLHFNRTEVHAVFDKKEDGWYHSRDILFLSARNTEDDNSRDILTEYLNSEDLRLAISTALPEEFSSPIDTELLEISLPEENEGVKKYNGVDCWYWTASPSASSSAYFDHVGNGGNSNGAVASAVGGCAPAFCVA